MKYYIYACANGNWKQLKIVSITWQTSFTQALKNNNNNNNNNKIKKKKKKKEFSLQWQD